MTTFFVRTILASAITLVFLIGTILYESDQIIIQQQPKQYIEQKRSRIREITQRVVVDLEEIQRRDEVPNWDKCPRWFKLATAFKRCLRYKLMTLAADKFWYEISPTVESCGANLIKHVLKAKYLVNKDDVKAVVLPQKENDSCIAVTVGIGNDISAEKRLKNYVPNIEFYGADPIEESGKIFKKIGQYHQIALSAKAGTLNASVLIGKNYTWKNVEAVTLGTFLNKTLALKYIDYLFVDIEGAEYQMLQQMVEDYVETNSTVICQINIELHGPMAKYNIDGFIFSRVIKHFLAKSAYISAWIPKPLAHHRMFLLNWKSEYCVKKFYNEWC